MVSNFIVICRQEVVWSGDDVIGAVSYVNKIKRKFPKHDDMFIFKQVKNQNG